MNQVLAITRKEWRAAFLSPVALIFLGIFLAASLFVFFFIEGFFARNMADARPFFAAMPILLVFLASAFTMRLWSEEARSGTLEVLLTLPLRLRDVVIGKFLAGLGLVGVALALTLPVPITISILGDLDWGPVIGGYLGLMLLASAYLAIGMFVSSLTDNQLVALMLSLVICGVFVIFGYMPRVVPMGFGLDEIWRSLGTGSRFESMLRGVLDLRDLVYYASLAGLFLVLNALVLEVRRWGRSERSQNRRKNVIWAMVLLGLNLIVLNLGLSGTQKLRADLTEWGEFSIAPVTRDMLRNVPEPLLIRGYFSDQTHPLLDPLIPRIRDFLRELTAAGSDNVTVEFADPTKDEEAEKEANSKYGIKSVPFMFSDTHKDSVINAYFHILIRYGDGFEVLDFKDLIDVDVHGTDVKVRLRNLEYDMARAIQKVVYGFKSIESVCARLASKATVKLIASSENLPENLKEIPGRIEKVAKELQGRCAGKLEFARIDPDDKSQNLSPEELYKQYHIKPMALSFFGQEYFYLYLVMDMGEKPETLNAAAALSEADIKKEIEASLGRHAPGLLKTVGVFVSETKQQQPQYPGMPPPPQMQMNYKRVEKMLQATYEVAQVDLKSGRVPGSVDVLLIMNPQDLGERERYAVDQFLMRGGSVVVAGGKHVFEPGYGGELNVKKVATGLEPLFKHYGVELGEGVVLDERNAAFPIPVTRRLGNLRVRDIKLVNYPPFVLVQAEGLASESPITAGLPAVVMHWPSPVRCVASAAEGQSKEGEPAIERECKPLLSTSDRAWEDTNFRANPDPGPNGEPDFAPPAKREVIPLGVTMVGTFESYYKKNEPPVLDEESPGTPPAADGKEKKGRKAGVIESSERVARLVVLGSSNFLEDDLLGIAQQVLDINKANMQLVANLADWSVEDSGLLQIRAKEQYARMLSSLGDGAKYAWQAGNFAFAMLAVVLIGILNLGRRNRATPILSAQSTERDGRAS